MIDLNTHAALNEIRASADEVLALATAAPDRVNTVLADMDASVFAKMCAGLRYPDDDLALMDALARIRATE